MPEALAQHPGTVQMTIDLDMIETTSFADHVTELMNRYHVPGLSIAVSQGESTRRKALGVASRGSGTACTAKILFDIASCSKSFTATAIALLVEDNEACPQFQ
jgi:CubicO group peptidase (beta-lactamase class C family)